MRLRKKTKILFRRMLIITGIAAALLILYIASGRYAFDTGKNNIPPSINSFGIRIPKGYTIHGIDVSRHQGKIDWKRVSEVESNGIRINFAYIKATEGISRQDENFRQNWEMASQYGLFRGAYHFYYPSRNAKMQAANYLKMVHLESGDLPPVIDIEYSNGKSAKEICAGLHIFIQILEKKYKTKPIIYTNINFFNRFLKDEFSSYPIWISCYFDHYRFFREFFTPWVIWQHSESGKVDGINGYVDLNVLSGDIKQLQSICVP